MRSQVRPSVKHTLSRAVRAPLVTITRRATYPAGRSMGFVFERLEDQRLVVMTVAHAFTPEHNPLAYKLELLDDRELVVDRFIFSKRHDVAFVVTKPVPNYHPIPFMRPVRERAFPPVVYTARNIVGGVQRVYLAEQRGAEVLDMTVMAPPWTECVDQTSTDARVFHHGSGTEAEMSELDAKGWCKLSYARMFTRPGFSGTPIWDDRWNLYGMGSRGNSSALAGQPEELCAFTPASELDRLWAEVRSYLLQLTKPE